MARTLKSEMQKQLERIRDWSEKGYVDQLREPQLREMIHTYHKLAVLALGVNLPISVSLRTLPAPNRRKRKAAKK